MWGLAAGLISLYMVVLWVCALIDKYLRSGLVNSF